MTIFEIKQKQYERFNSITDTSSRHWVRIEGYLLVTEKELNELAEEPY